ncbi:MAG: universal stress protein [Herbiconiux sp.]|uniref:universal stress protein n=1 Tax=Herbiconiux sp. TaxID=1871186 RepID=UPI00120AD813|nr:universal stress protein [Herbiconiux sp.]TAJ46308.1 MAG: universal stress protein [Herbiconiux sp.]
MSESTVTISHPEAARAGLGEFSRVVVGVDGSEASIDALRKAGVIAEAFGAKLDVVCVWTYPISRYTVVPPEWYPDRDAAHTVREVAAVVFGETKPDYVKLSIVEGSAARVLIDESDTADLIVTGSRGHGGFAGLLLGSVSAEIAAHAHCPVLIVHPHAAPKSHHGSPKEGGEAAG